MEEVVCPPGLHTSLTPEDAVTLSVTEVIVQVNTLSAPAFTEGASVSLVTVTSPKHVLEELAGSVIVKRYVPAEEIKMESRFVPLLIPLPIEPPFLVQTNVGLRISVA